MVFYITEKWSNMKKNIILNYEDQTSSRILEVEQLNN